MDFVCDHTAEGIRFRVLTLVDDFSRRSPGLLVERSIGGGRVVRFLEELGRPFLQKPFKLDALRRVLAGVVKVPA